MNEKLDTKMQQLATMYAEKTFGEYAELDSEEDCNAFIGMEVDFKAGFRTCHAIMIEEQENLEKLLYERDQIIDQLKFQLAVVVEALKYYSKGAPEGDIFITTDIADNALKQIEEHGS